MFVSQSNTRIGTSKVQMVDAPFDFGCIKVIVSLVENEETIHTK